MAAQYNVALRQKWDTEYRKAIELDGWGQVEEAREIYDSIASRMESEMQAVANPEWTAKQREAVRNLAICLRLRSQVIRRGGVTGINCENMKSLVSVFENLFKKDKTFPIDLEEVPEDDLKKAMGLTDNDNTEVEDVVDQVQSMALRPRQKSEDANTENFDTPKRGRQFAGASGSPVPERTDVPERAPPAAAAAAAPAKKKGKQVLIHVEKIGLKDFEIYEVPKISVNVVSGGKTMETWQDTPASKERADRHILFGHTITLKSTYTDILPGAAIFFEFKHFKQKKSKESTKCWTFLDQGDLKEGIHMLELYKKPTDLKCKKLSLLTIKELYLNVRIEFVASP